MHYAMPYGEVERFLRAVGVPMLVRLPWYRLPCARAQNGMAWGMYMDMGHGVWTWGMRYGHGVWTCRAYAVPMPYYAMPMPYAS